jgi:hypothetical protein
VTPAEKTYVVGSIAYTGGGRRYSWQKPTQQTAVYEQVKAAGPGGTTKTRIVAALKDVQFEKGVGVSDRNVAYYLNALAKTGYIAEKGAAGAVNPQASADEALYAALEGLESALVAYMKEKGRDADMAPIYSKYKTFKAVAISPKNVNDPKFGYTIDRSNEVIQGLRLTLVEMIKLVVR